MSRLDTHRVALQAADPEVTPETLCTALDAQGAGFASFIIGHGLGPLWHERTGRAEFRDSRVEAEALFLAQQLALREVDVLLTDSRIDHALIKGAANRVVLYRNPALRACHDLDVLVRPQDKLRAVSVLAKAGFVARPASRSISREIVLSGRHVDIDLHWNLLREGRLRLELTSDFLDRRQRVGDNWMLSDDDALYVLLVHPAFAKHLDSWEMGLHRVLDTLEWLRQRSVHWPVVRDLLEETGVRTAAWATLRWVELLAGTRLPAQVASMRRELVHAGVRHAWLDRWLRADLSARTADLRWLRLLAFSSLLHDTPGDALRAFAGQRRAARRAADDLRDFSGPHGQ